MARVRMVTRTIESNEYSVMVVVGTEVKTVTVTLGNTSDLKPEKIEKEIKAKLTAENLGLFVQITGHNKIEKLFGMSETEFLKYAKELPER